MLLRNLITYLHEENWNITFPNLQPSYITKTTQDILNPNTRFETLILVDKNIGKVFQDTGTGKDFLEF